MKTKYWILIGVAVAAVAVYFLFIKKDDNAANKRSVTNTGGDAGKVADAAGKIVDLIKGFTGGSSKGGEKSLTDNGSGDNVKPNDDDIGDYFTSDGNFTGGAN